jgi:hypothetical protein
MAPAQPALAPDWSFTLPSVALGQAREAPRYVIRNNADIPHSWSM